MRRLVVIGAVSLMAAACGLPFGIGLPSTSQLINGAADNLGKASSFELSGKFTSGSDDYTIDLQYQSAGSAAHMDVTTGSTHVELEQFNGKVYYRGKDVAAGYAGSDAFGQAEPNAVGDKWFTSKSATPIDMSGFTDASKVKANFLTSLSLNRKDNVSVNGVDTAELSDSSSILNITESSPYHLVRLRTQPGKTASDLKNTDLAFTNYNKSFNLVEPADALDLDDPTTFPPFYEVSSINLSKCDSDPCVVSVTVKNDAGLKGASAPSTVTFTLTEDANSAVVGTCKANIAPDVDNGKSTTVSCTVTGGAWATFVQNAANGGPSNFHAKPEVDNPSYD